REPAPRRPRWTGGRLVRALASSLASDGAEIVAFAPPRRRLTTGSHAEFVGALVQQFRGSLASLKGASELLARRRHDLDEAVLADPERGRLGLEILFEALSSPAGAATARMPVAGFLTVAAPTLDLDEQQRRFALRSAFRVLDMEGCQLRVRNLGDETRAEVRL